MPSRDFFKFVLVGGGAAMVNILARIVLERAMRFELAVILAYLCGMAVAFILNRQFVFRQDGWHSARTQAWRFAAVNGVALVQVWVVVIGLARWILPGMGMTWHTETVAHILGVGSPVVSSYFLHRVYTFA